MMTNEQTRALEMYTRIGEMLTISMMLERAGAQDQALILASMLDGIELYHEKGLA